eukprot:156913-Prorocentrum_minimum.AAC.3
MGDVDTASQANRRNWVGVARTLQAATDAARPRSAADCLMRYQRSLNPDFQRSSWTPAEDAALQAKNNFQKHKKNRRTLMFYRN